MRLSSDSRPQPALSPSNLLANECAPAATSSAGRADRPSARIAGLRNRKQGAHDARAAEIQKRSYALTTPRRGRPSIPEKPATQRLAAFSFSRCAPQRHAAAVRPSDASIAARLRACGYDECKRLAPMKPPPIRRTAHRECRTAHRTHASACRGIATNACVANVSAARETISPGDRHTNVIAILSPLRRPLSERRRVPTCAGALHRIQTKGVGMLTDIPTLTSEEHQTGSPSTSRVIDTGSSSPLKTPRIYRRAG